ncbi:MAG: catechol 2,3-dioxygenase [Thermoleophilaceae bacterium]|nr:catechol 2,3-dioxygenase [Thermoleophilaceae bacterium]
MVKRMGSIGLHVKDLGRSVEFLSTVLGLAVTERSTDRAYLTSNSHHHELTLIQSGERGYDHVGLELADREALESAERALSAAGARIVGYEDEPGVERALRVVVSGGHVLKLYCGMEERGPLPDDPDRPIKFEHVSLKVRNLGGVERVLKDGLGFGLSDRVGKLLSWWHCGPDHHSVALSRAPRSRLYHYAWAFGDVAALTRTADRAAAAGHPLEFGLGRHGPGNNHYIYFHDADGFIIECCSELAQLGPGTTYDLGRKWTLAETNLWGPKVPLSFIGAGMPIASSARRGPNP